MPNIVEILVTSRNLAEPGFRSSAEGARSLSKTMNQMAAVSTAALVGVGVASVKMASEYQSSTTRLVTSAGESVDNIDMVRKGMLDMAGQVGVSANDLSKSMYFVEAAGYHAADGLKVLKAAAEGAAAEGADTTTVAKALTDILVDYHLKASSAADITSKMVEAVAHGKTNLQEFSGAFASIVPAASAAGIGFTDVMAALSNMTNHGFTARRAAMNLAQALRSLLNPTKPMAAAFADFGVSADVLQKKLHGKNGLTDAMEYLATAALKAGKEGTPEFAAALKRLMGTAPGANAALSTVGANFKATSDTIKDVGKATQDSNGKVQGFALVQKSLGQQTKQLTAGFESLMIEIGQKLIPMITSLVEWMNKHKDIVMITLATIGILMASLIAYSIVVKTVAMATALWEGAQIALDIALDADPVVLIVLALIALAAGLVLAYQHSKTFRDIVQEIGKVAEVAFKAVVGWAEVAFRWIKDHWKLVLSILTGPIGAATIFIIDHWKQISGSVSWMIGEIKRHWRVILGVITGPVGIAVTFVLVHWKTIADFAGRTVRVINASWSMLVGVLEYPFRAAWGTIVWVINQINSFLTSLPGRVAGAVKSAGSNVLGSIGHAIGFAHGGTVGAAATGGTRSGLVMVGEQGPELVHLPSGSHVMSNPDTRREMAGSGGGGVGSPIVVVLQMDGHEMSRVLVNPMRRTIKRISGGNVQAALGS